MTTTTDQPELTADDTPDHAETLPTAPDPSETPASSVEPEVASFTMPIESFPFEVPLPDCCPGYRVRIEEHEHPLYGDECMEYVAVYTHRRTCAIWLYI